jgi:hypothetical protein
MKESLEERIVRLRARKHTLLDIIAGMGKYPNRFYNCDHKRGLLNDEVTVIDDRLTKLLGE